MLKKVKSIDVDMQDLCNDITHGTSGELSLHLNLTYRSSAKPDVSFNKSESKGHSPE